MNKALKLFPLQTVMFPGSRIPLHIFEERYKRLIADVLTNDGTFGIVLMNQGRLSGVGTSVRVTEVAKQFENGELDIIVSGIRRFSIKSYAVGEDGLYEGLVEYLEDNNLDFDPDLMAGAVEDYNKIVEMAYKGSIRPISLDEENISDGIRSACFLMAEKCGLGLEEKQHLLELDDEQKRLEYIREYFEMIIPKLKEAERISDIIRSDGYLQ